MAVGSTKVVQVTNIAPQATKDQMHILFGYLGKIEDIRLYPTIRDVSCPVQSRICYIKFMDSTTVGIAQHMTNTVFIDRALIVIPVQNGEIPDEYYALEMTRNGTIVPGLNVNEPKMPPNVSNSVQGTGSEQVIVTTDPQLEANELPLYPPLPATYDSVKIEETRRTILMRNVDSEYSNEDIIAFFNPAGEVKYLRTCSRKSDGTSHMLIEFSDQNSLINALKLNGNELKGKPVDIQHATQPIVKPQAKSNEAAQKEIEEAMTRFKEAQNMINASIEPVIGMLTKDKRSRRSRSRSHSRRHRSRSRSRRSRSRSRRRRSGSRARRSRSKERRRRSKSRSKRSRTRSPSRSSRSRKSRSKSKKRRSKDRAKSRDKERKRSRERKRSKSRDKTKSKEKKSDKESSVVSDKKRSRSRSPSRRRSRSKERKSKDKRRSRSRGRRRTPSPPPKHRKRSRSRSKDKKRDKKDKKRDRSRSKSKVPRNYDEEEKGFDSGRSKDKEVDVAPPGGTSSGKESPEKSDNMDISNSP